MHAAAWSSGIIAVLTAAGVALWAFWAACVGYLLLLTLFAALHPLLNRRRASETGTPGEPDVRPRFCVLIPAHDEELLLGASLDRLRALQYPAQAFDVVVIADNCTDRTAAIAREHGATVLERVDADRRGKGYALDWALRQLLDAPPPHPVQTQQKPYDAFLILDADSHLSPNALEVMRGALARGHRAVQALYQVDNADESWRTRLMTCALALAHYVKPLGRSTLGLSDGLKGNGMCFTREVLERVPWSGESITEDIEYTLRLVQAGVRIAFAPEAVVLAQMPTTGKQAATQRERWEAGRYALLRRACGLLARNLTRPMVADRAIELIIPPFAELFALPTLAALGGLAWRLAAPDSATARLWLLAWAVVLLGEAVYLLAGMAIARVPLKVAASLLLAPFYVGWKLALYAALVARGGPGGWRRTARN